LIRIGPIRPRAAGIGVGAIGTAGPAFFGVAVFILRAAAIGIRARAWRAVRGGTAIGVTLRMPVHIRRIGRYDAPAFGLQRLHPASKAFHRLLALRALAIAPIVGRADFNRMSGLDRLQTSRRKLGFVVEQAQGSPAGTRHNVGANPVVIGPA
jgi:hypothetical protein